MKSVVMARKKSVNCESTCEWADNFSSSVWYRISFCRRNSNSLRIFETTITQDLLFDFCHLSSVNEKIVMLESGDELTNGNDLEMFISIRKNRYIRFPVQAKIVYKDERYRKMNRHYKNNPKFQIDRLLNYASKIKSIPLYFLYSESEKINPDSIARHYDGNNIKFQHFGVSVVHAFYIKHNYFSEDRIQIPTFSQIIPMHSLTLMEFLCFKEIRNAYIGLKSSQLMVRLLSNYPSNLFEGKLDSFEQKYKIYNREEVVKEIGWINILDKSERIEHFNKLNKVEKKFSPRYRIIIDDY